MLHHVAAAAVQPRAVSQDDAGVDVIVVVEAAGIRECVAGNFQREKLVRFAAVDRVRHNAEFGRIETVKLAEIAASRRRDMARTGGLEMALGAPVGWRIADLNLLAANVAPELIGPICAREQTTNPDHGDVAAAIFVFRIGHHKPLLTRRERRLGSDADFTAGWRRRRWRRRRFRDVPGADGTLIDLASFPRSFADHDFDVVDRSVQDFFAAHERAAVRLDQINAPGRELAAWSRPIPCPSRTGCQPTGPN